MPMSAFAVLPSLSSPPVSAWGERRRRFLDAYRQSPCITQAAKLAGVARGSVYRWRADTAFVTAMREAADEFYAEHRRKVIAAEAERKRWREERERARRPQRQAVIRRLSEHLGPTTRNEDPSPRY